MARAGEQCGRTLRDAGWARRRLAMNPRLDDFWRRDALEAILHDGEAISIEHGGPARLLRSIFSRGIQRRAFARLERLGASAGGPAVGALWLVVASVHWSGISARQPLAASPDIATQKRLQMPWFDTNRNGNKSSLPARQRRVGERCFLTRAHTVLQHPAKGTSKNKKPWSPKAPGSNVFEQTDSPLALFFVVAISRAH